MASAKKHHETEGNTPMNSPGHCTDCFCIIVFAAALAGLAGTINYAVENGHIERITSFPQWDGKPCDGENGRGHFIYFCQSDSVTGVSLDLHHHMCVHSCPKGTVGEPLITCTYDDNGIETPRDTTPYATTPIGGVFCMPDAGELSTEVRKMIGANPYLDSALRIMEVLRHTEIILIGVGVATICGFVYLFIVEWCAKLIVFLSLFIMTSVPSAIGGTLIYASTQGGLQVNGTHITSGNVDNDLKIGIGCVALSALSLCIVCCYSKSLNKAVESLQEAASCIAGKSSLVVEPWLALAIKVVVLVPLFVGFIVLATASTSAKEGTTIDLTLPGSVLPYTFEADELQTMLLLYYAFMFLWIAELLHCVSQFVVIYVAEEWYFKVRGARRLSLCSSCGWLDMCKGYLSAVTVHLGSLIFGALLVTIFRGLAWFAAVVAKISENEGTNPLMTCLARAVACCAFCMQKIIEYTNTLAFCDVAMNSHSYCEASSSALSVISSNGVGLAILEGSLFIFSFTGLGSIGAGTAAIVWFLCTVVDRYRDPTSAAYVSDPTALAMACGVLGCVLAIPFMHLLDTIADVMFYCKSVQIHRRKMAAAGEEAVEPQCGCFGAWGRPAPSVQVNKGETRRLLGNY
eukprot:TRINITY_DN66689_c0_g1_i1.p1 TRINITY_DN66689_c0_g1~~TRINITY_DN66689_c0_g1_i1.p1  ORF type:complete len:630 (-),score=52.94 TRINITY_DN66689_c0_g1_i1:259-2148(-)